MYGAIECINHDEESIFLQKLYTVVTKMFVATWFNCHSAIYSQRNMAKYSCSLFHLKTSFQLA